MAPPLELRVVAEGVETEPSATALQSMGCDELQGFLFAKPMSATALALWADGETDRRRWAFAPRCSARRCRWQGRRTERHHGAGRRPRRTRSADAPPRARRSPR
jgi:predicted signal transduction protein with EAL and GGDEF domain